LNKLTKFILKCFIHRKDFFYADNLPAINFYLTPNKKAATKNIAA